MKIMLANFTKMVEDSGGLAKVTCDFANEMKKRGHEVFLVYSDEREGKFYFHIDESIPCYDLRCMNGSRIKYPVWLKAKREILRAIDIKSGRTVNNEFAEKYLLCHIKNILDQKKPDVIVSFQPAASMLLICDLHTSIPVITMSHGDPEDYFNIYPVKEIDAVDKSVINQVLLPSFAQHIKNHLPNAKTIVIGNAVPQFDEQANLDYEKKQYKIIFVGRLARGHKRPHLLIQAFAKLAKSHPDWIVELWGAHDGEAYYKELESMITTNGLSSQIFLKGATDKVAEKLQQADIFAFPSAYEGFGLALAEGMSMGLPAVGYKNCPAVNELIVNDVNGYLCDDGVDDFADKLQSLMDNKNIRIRMGQQARNDMQKFAPKKIWDAWENLLTEVYVKK